MGINTLAKRLGLTLNVGEGQRPNYRTSSLESEKFGTLDIVFDYQFETKIVEIFVPLDKSKEFNSMLDSFDLVYKHKMNGLEFMFHNEENIVEKITYYLNILK